MEESSIILDDCISPMHQIVNIDPVEILHQEEVFISDLIRSTKDIIERFFHDNQELVLEINHWEKRRNDRATNDDMMCYSSILNKIFLACEVLIAEHEQALDNIKRMLEEREKHLTTLLSSSDMNVVLAVLNLLYVSSKRSNFITGLNAEKRQTLLLQLLYLAESWGGKENGFGLAECCQNLPITAYPSSASTLHFEYYAESDEKAHKKASNTVIAIHIENVDEILKSPAQIMEELLKKYDVPEDKQIQLFTHIRLAHSFSDYPKRLLCVQARLQALSVLVYCNAVPDNVNSLLYNGLIEELVDVLELQDNSLIELKAAALRTMTSIIHLDRNPILSTILDAASYHGFLPVLVRNCIQALTDPYSEPFPLPFATALFSFLYHFASYESGGDALVSCGMVEALLKVINFHSTETEHITLVTRAVRVIDLITNLDMQAFQAHDGLASFIQRLELEVNVCRKEQPHVTTSIPENQNTGLTRSSSVDNQTVLETDALSPENAKLVTSSKTEPLASSVFSNSTNNVKQNHTEKGLQCFPERAALLEKMLNFLKKYIQDPVFSDSIRHLMDGSLPQSLKHIISNVEYYGPTVFLSAINVVTAYVFLEQTLLPALQDNGLAGVMFHALLVKEVPATREMLASLPNALSALCSNIKGFKSFASSSPFQQSFRDFLSKRKSISDPIGEPPTNLADEIEKLRNNLPSFRADATTAAIIKGYTESKNWSIPPQFLKQAGENMKKSDQLESHPSSYVNPSSGVSPNGVAREIYDRPSEGYDTPSDDDENGVPYWDRKHRQKVSEGSNRRNSPSSSDNYDQVNCSYIKSIQEKENDKKIKNKPNKHSGNFPWIKEKNLKPPLFIPPKGSFRKFIKSNSRKPLLIEGTYQNNNDVQSQTEAADAEVLLSKSNRKVGARLDGSVNRIRARLVEAKTNDKEQKITLLHNTEEDLLMRMEALKEKEIGEQIKPGPDCVEDQQTESLNLDMDTEKPQANVDLDSGKQLKKKKAKKSSRERRRDRALLASLLGNEKHQAQVQQDTSEAVEITQSEEKSEDEDAVPIATLYFAEAEQQAKEQPMKPSETFFADRERHGGMRVAVLIAGIQVVLSVEIIEPTMLQNNVPEMLVENQQNMEVQLDDEIQEKVAPNEDNPENEVASKKRSSKKKKKKGKRTNIARLDAVPDSSEHQTQVQQDTPEDSVEVPLSDSSNSIETTVQPNLTDGEQEANEILGNNKPTKTDVDDQDKNAGIQLVVKDNITEQLYVAQEKPQIQDRDTIKQDYIQVHKISVLNDVTQQKSNKTDQGLEILPINDSDTHKQDFDIEEQKTSVLDDVTAEKSDKTEKDGEPNKDDPEIEMKNKEISTEVKDEKEHTKKEIKYQPLMVSLLSVPYIPWLHIMPFYNDDRSNSSSLPPSSHQSSHDAALGREMSKDETVSNGETLSAKLNALKQRSDARIMEWWNSYKSRMEMCIKFMQHSTTNHTERIKKEYKHLMEIEEAEKNNYRLQLEKARWFLEKINRIEAEIKLLLSDKFSLSDEDSFLISGRNKSETLQNLVESNHLDTDGLHSNLRKPCSQMDTSATGGMSHNTRDHGIVDMEIDKKSLKIKKKIGQGYFSDVWEGCWNRTTPVAIKTLRKGTMDPKDFLAEAKIMKTFRHRNIVTLVAVCTLKKPMYIITELMKYGSLKEFLKGRGRSLKLLQLIDMAAQIAAGMAYLESQNYIHRDLAARNILVGESNIVKIADFGLARFMKEDIILSKIGQYLQVRWLAPEILKHNEFSRKSDVWAYGIVVVEIFTYGNIPYADMDDSEVVKKILAGFRMPCPRGCPPYIYKILLECWEKYPLKRPSFTEILEKLSYFFKRI